LNPFLIELPFHGFQLPFQETAQEEQRNGENPSHGDKGHRSQKQYDGNPKKDSNLIPSSRVCLWASVWIVEVRMKLVFDRIPFGSLISKVLVMDGI